MSEGAPSVRMQNDSKLWKVGLCAVLTLALGCGRVVPMAFAAGGGAAAAESASRRQPDPVPGFALDHAPETDLGCEADQTVALGLDANLTEGDAASAGQNADSEVGDQAATAPNTESPATGSTAVCPNAESEAVGPAPASPNADAPAGDAPAEGPATDCESMDATAPVLPVAPLAVVGGIASVGDFSEFDRAMKNPSVSHIRVMGDIVDQPFITILEHHYVVDRNLTIEGVGSTPHLLRFIWFDVNNGGTLTLTGSMNINCNRTGIVNEAINVVDVKGGGALEVAGSVSMATDDGHGDYRDRGYGVYVEGGGRAVIGTSGAIRGSSGAVYVAPGATARITGNGRYQSENATGHDDSGNVGANAGKGRMPVENDGSLMVYGNPRIEGLGTNKGGVSVVLGGTYQNTGAEKNTNPSFVNNGKVYLTSCKIGAGPNKSKNLIFNEGSHTLILSSGDNVVDIEGFKLKVQAPSVHYDEDDRALKVEGAFTGNVSDVSGRTGLYQTNTGFANLSELVENKNEEFHFIESSQFDLDAGRMTAQEEPGTPSLTQPYVFTMIDLADGHNFGGKTDVLNLGGMIWIFGPTAPLSQISVDVTWGSMEHLVTGTWNPETHQYDDQGLVPAAGDAASVGVRVSEATTRPIMAAFDFDVEERYKGKIEGFFEGLGDPVRLGPGGDVRGELSLRLAPGAQLSYFSDKQSVGRATVGIALAS